MCVIDVTTAVGHYFIVVQALKVSDHYPVEVELKSLTETADEPGGKLQTNRRTQADLFWLSIQKLIDKSF